jgi:hypothetical protein
MTAEALLSDNFVEYSSKIVALHERKKELVADFKKLYEQHRLDVKALDDQAIELNIEFEKWQSEVRGPRRNA